MYLCISKPLTTRTIFYPNFASVIHVFSLSIPVLVVKLMIAISFVDAYD